MFEVLKSQILHLMQKDGAPLRLELLEQELGVRGDLRPAFQQAVQSLCAEGSLIVGSHGVLRLPSLSGEVTGIFKSHVRGFGFVSPQQVHVDGDVFIPAKATAGAMTGDRVVAQVSQGSVKDPDRWTGRVIKILERAHSRVVGTIRQEKDRWLVEPDGGEALAPIQIDGTDFRKIQQGDKVLVEIRSYPTASHPARGVITDVLGRPGRHDTEIAAIIRRYGLEESFDESSLVEAWNAKVSYNPRDVDGREDLTDDLIVTIDPPDAQDYDDAISLAALEHGCWLLGVHIADVSHFVKEGSGLDFAARRRGNSVYLPGKTLPMLPEMLSNEICSLQPNQPRYTKSVFLTYNRDGVIRSARFANTIIRSKARLSYEQVDEALKGRTGDLAGPIVSLLHDMEHLARTIEARRRQAGMLQLEMPEIKVVMDPSGQVTGVQRADASYPHTIIEMFMVEANVAVASLLDPLCIPFIRRIHPDPDPAALRQLSQTLRLLGVTLSRQPGRHDFQRLLAQVGSTRVALPVNLLVLRSLERAAYTPAAVGHYALAASKYCHFTSPIRRYADLMVHRDLQAYLTGNVNAARHRHAFEDLAEIGRHISHTEQTAEDAEKEVKTTLVLGLLRRRIGEELDGVVMSLSRYGAFVLLPEFGVEGLVRPEALGPDHWQFDSQSQCLLGRHTGAVLRMGQNLRVRIMEVRPAAGHLELAPASAGVFRSVAGGPRKVGDRLSLQLPSGRNGRSQRRGRRGNH